VANTPNGEPSFVPPTMPGGLPPAMQFTQDGGDNWGGDRMSPEVDKVVQAIVHIMGEVEEIPKSSGQGLGYDFVAEKSQVVALKKLFVKYGIVCLPVKTQVVEVERYLSAKSKPMVRRVIRSVYRILHVSGQWIDTMAYGEASDSADKVFNKCMTAAFKYVKRQTFMLSSEGDDPDFEREERATPEQLRQSRQDRPGRPISTPSQSGATQGQNRPQGASGGQNTGQQQSNGHHKPQKSLAERFAACTMEINKATDVARVVALVNMATQPDSQGRVIGFSQEQVDMIKGMANSRFADIFLTQISESTHPEDIESLLVRARACIPNPTIQERIRVAVVNRCNELASDAPPDDAMLDDPVEAVF
jgi:ERF superfamily